MVLASQTTLLNKNLYAYCNNNTVNTVDSDGYFAIPAILLKVSTDVFISMGTAYLVARATGQKIEFMEIVGVGLATGLSSASVITDVLTAALSGVDTFFDTYEKYSLGTALVAGGIDAIISYAGFNSTVLKAVPENDVLTQGAITAVFGTTDSMITEGANILVEAIATPKPKVRVVKELVGKNKRVTRATYVKGGKSCAVK